MYSLRYPFAEVKCQPPYVLILRGTCLLYTSDAADDLLCVDLVRHLRKNTTETDSD